MSMLKLCRLSIAIIQVYLVMLPVLFSSALASFSSPVTLKRHRFAVLAVGNGFGLGNLEKSASSTKMEDISALPYLEVKTRLLDLLPKLMGSSEEFRLLEIYVNALEDKYAPPQTLEFLNLAMGGEWQLLFSTNLKGGPKTNFRLRDMFQIVEPQQLKGSVTNTVLWDYAEDSVTFDATGTFSVKCNYSINQGARMSMNLDEHILKPSRGSKIPSDVPALAGLLYRAMPTEFFDPSNHGMDTTYLDGNLRIVRITGAQFEGVRNIFIRRESFDIISK